MTTPRSKDSSYTEGRIELAIQAFKKANFKAFKPLRLHMAPLLRPFDAALVAFGHDTILSHQTANFLLLKKKP
jgi:hypothetical protein